MIKDALDCYLNVSNPLNAPYTVGAVIDDIGWETVSVSITNSELVLCFAIDQTRYDDVHFAYRFRLSVS